MDSDFANIKTLIKKIDTGLQQIKLRSINTLHTKVTLGVIEITKLHLYTDMPGVLMNWINEHQRKSEQLYKSINIIFYFTKTQQGLHLLKKYESLEFFQQLRNFICINFANPQEYIQLIERIIKSLLPLGKNQNNQRKTDENCPENNIEEERIQRIAPQHYELGKKQGKKNYMNSKCQWQFIMLKQTMTELQEKNIFDMTVQLKYGKKQMQYECLMCIRNFLETNSEKYFRCRGELINQLMQYVRANAFPWLCCEILSKIIKGMIKSQNKSNNWDHKLVNRDNTVVHPQRVSVCFELKPFLFESVYSVDIILLFAQNLKKVWIPSLSSIISKFTYEHCLKILQMLDKKQLQAETIIELVKYTSQQFPESNTILAQFYQSHHSLPFLKAYKEETETKLSFEYLKTYLNINVKKKQHFVIGYNLHRIGQLLEALEKGMPGVLQDPHLAISLYLETFLTLAAAVTRQDPLMSYYPKIKLLILELSNSYNSEVRSQLYYGLSKLLNNYDSLIYANNDYPKAQLLQLVMSDSSLFETLFKNSLVLEQTTFNMLQIIKQMLNKSNEFNKIITKFTNIIFALTFHSSQKLSSISKYIYSHLTNHNKLDIILMKLFSSDENVRKTICMEILNINEDIVQDLTVMSKRQEKRKMLKVSYNMITNYLNIIMNMEIQQEFRKKSIIELIENVERAEVTTQLRHKLQQILELLFPIVCKNQNNSQNQVHCLLLELFFVINDKMHNSNQQGQESTSIQLPKEMLLSLLSYPYRKKIKNYILQILYRQCFRSPFSKKNEKCWVYKYYPHVSIENMHEEEVTIPIKRQSQKRQEKCNEVVSTNNFREYSQKVLEYSYNKQIVNIDFSILQKEINSALLHSSMISSLSLPAYFLARIERQSLPLEVQKLSTSLLNYLFSNKENISPAFSQDLINIVCNVGFQRTKQVEAIALSNKYSLNIRINLMEKLGKLTLEHIQSVIKSIKQANDYEQILLYKLLLKNKEKYSEFNEYSLVLLFTNIMKNMKSQNRDLKSCAFYLLATLLQHNCPLASPIICLNNTISALIDQETTLRDFVLGLESVKMILRQIDIEIAQQQTMRALLSRILLIIRNKFTDNTPMLLCSFITFFNFLLDKGLHQLLSELNLIDFMVNLLNLQNPAVNCSQQLLLYGSCCQYLVKWKQIEADLSQYLLASTNILQNLLTIISVPAYKQAIKNSKDIGVYFLQRFGGVMHYLQTKDDYFVFKLNKVLQTNQNLIPDGNIFFFLGQFCQYGNQQFLKMFAWLTVIQWKGRSILDEDHEFCEHIINVYLSKNKIHLCHSIIAVSNHAKKYLVNSEQFLDLIKKAHTIVDAKVVKDMKNKKKMIKNAQTGSQEDLEVQTVNSEQEYILKIMVLLTSLFHSANQTGTCLELNKEVTRKLFALLQKLYSNSFLSNNEKIQQQFIKLLNNLAQCIEFSQQFSTHISEGNSTMLQDICSNIIKFQPSYQPAYSQNMLSLKKSLMMLGVLVRNETVRTTIFRNKIIEDLNNKITRVVQDPKKQLTNVLQYVYEIVNFYLFLSEHKQANLKIMGDKKILQILIQLLTEQKMALLEEKVLLLIQNLACFKQNKTLFLNNKEIHKVLLWLLGQAVPYKHIIITIIYNFVYKTASALKIYRKKEVIQFLSGLQRQQFQGEQSINLAVYQSLMQALIQN